MATLSFIQLIILLILLFVLFGDFKNLSENIKKSNNFFNTKSKEKVNNQEKRDLNP